MSVLRPAYQTRYGYPWRIAAAAEFWWRIEHLSRGERLSYFGYRQRKAWERRGVALRPGTGLWPFHAGTNTPGCKCPLCADDDTNRPKRGRWTA